MESILITLLIVLVVAAIVWWIVSLLPLPPPVKNIVLAILGIILLVWLLTHLGIFGDSGRIRLGR